MVLLGYYGIIDLIWHLWWWVVVLVADCPFWRCSSSIWLAVPFVAEWSKAPEFDAETGGESPVQAPVWAVTFSPYV